MPGVALSFLIPVIGAYVCYNGQTYLLKTFWNQTIMQKKNYMKKFNEDRDPENSTYWYQDTTLGRGQFTKAELKVL